MKINLPVTQNEVSLRDDIMIVSRTDLKGIITYVNADFLEVSGFTEAELIGTSHNIVRHPDMPVEGFKDLWDTLKAGRPWNGFVKNRCKNGDYYWVEANATPIWEGGRITGYLSLRRKPSRAMVEAHEAAYRLLREGKAKNLAVSNGQGVSTRPWPRLLRRWRDLSLSRKVTLAASTLMVTVMSVLTLLLGQHVAQRLEDDNVVQLQGQLQLIRAMIDVRAQAMQKEIQRLKTVYAATYTGPYSLIRSGEITSIRAGNLTLNDRTEEIDRYTALTGAYATVLMRQGDDFVRVATSLKNKNGERATGTLLGPEHPAHAQVLDGKPWSGPAHMLGKDWYTAYTPIKDASGAVIGLFFTGLDVSAEMAELKRKRPALPPTPMSQPQI